MYPPFHPDPAEIRTITTVLSGDDKFGRTHDFAVTYDAWSVTEETSEPDPYSMQRGARIRVKSTRIKVDIRQVLHDGHDVTGLLHPGLWMQLADAAKKREYQLADVRSAEGA